MRFRACSGVPPGSCAAGVGHPAIRACLSRCTFPPPAVSVVLPPDPSEAFGNGEHALLGQCVGRQDFSEILGVDDGRRLLGCSGKL